MNILFSVDAPDGSRDSAERHSLESALKKRFNNVVYLDGSYPVREKRSLWFKVARELNRNIDSSMLKKHYSNLLHKHYLEVLESKSHLQYQYLLSISQYYSPAFLSLLKERNPEIKLILFLWDKLEYTQVSSTVSSYDYVFTFDYQDSKEHGFIFRSSFFVDECTKDTVREKDIGLYYLGRLKDKERYNFVTSIHDTCQKMKIKTKLHLYTDKHNEITGVDLLHPIISRKKISYFENIELAKRAKVILELNLKNQTGLTLRSLECIGTRSKLITNNRHIKNYDFYNENNIFIINDEQDVKRIPIDFFTGPYHNLNESIVKKYSATGFVDEIFEQL